MLIALACVPARAQSQDEPPPDRDLQQRVRVLEAEVAELKALVKQLQASGQPSQAALAGASNVTAQAPPGSPDPASAGKPSGIADLLGGTTLSFGIDGYYGYNFNAPVGRVNLLRAYDVMSNSFSLNQANLIVEHAPDVDAGRRFGARLDLQFGQATETLQGSAANELRPQVYRSIFQAYGTYVFRAGSGLTVDFGKWSSAMGIENNYTKDQINYSRSYFFNFLPFYHMGVRATYAFNSKFSATYAVVNGAQQTEDFNGFKTQLVFLTFRPTKSVTWNLNYHVGQEQPDVVRVLNPGLPPSGMQPGLPAANISPAPDGRLHILDSYVTWNATPKWTLALEGDYVIDRVLNHSAPARVSGGAAYARYQLTPNVALASRAEYLSDRGGLFSGVTQALKENTVTVEYKFAEGFLSRAEWRRDFSNQPYFRTDVASVLSQQQNTATLGLVWWFGGKQGSW